MSIVMFSVCFISKDESNNKLKFDYKEFLKYGLIISGIVLLGISFFFIRNAIVNHGDMLGMKSFLNACEEGARDDLKPSNRETAKNLGMSYLESITSTRWYGYSWILLTFKSFICVLGAFQYYIHDGFYLFYAILFTIGIIGTIINLIANRKQNWKEKVMYISLLIVAIVTIILSIQYSYATDYQPQGRYIYPIWIPVILYTSAGINAIIKFITKFIKSEKIKLICEWVVFGTLCLTILIIMFVVVNPMLLATTKIQ